MEIRRRAVATSANRRGDDDPPTGRRSPDRTTIPRQDNGSPRNPWRFVGESSGGRGIVADDCSCTGLGDRGPVHMHRVRGRGRHRLAGTVDGCSRQRTPSGASADSPEARTCDLSDSPGRLWLEWCDGERSNASGTGSSRPALSTSRCAQRRRTAARSPARACCDPQGSGCFRQTTVRMSGSDPTTTPSRTPGAPAVRTITAAVRRSAPRRSRRPSSTCAGAAAMKPSSPRTNRRGD